MKKIIAMCTALLLFVTGVCCKNNNENMSKMDNNDKTEKILFINGSPQVNSNTAALAKTLLEGFNYETLMLTERQWCQCREGLHALPKIMFDLFFKIGGGVSNRWCFFNSGWDIFEGGHEARLLPNSL